VTLVGIVQAIVSKAFKAYRFRAHACAYTSLHEARLAIVGSGQTIADGHLTGTVIAEV
jgi:hypothetical protein